jgi:glycosyltransferase involved in cell wall biosynthesis
MRILYIHNINQVAQTYGEDLVRRGHSVSIFEPSLIGASAPLPLKVALMPQRLFNLRNVAGMLDENHYDLVHIHWASYGILGLMSRIPFVVHCHGTDVRSRLRHPLFRKMLEPFLQRAAAVLCITPDLLPVVRSVRPDALLSPAPIDTERFVPAKNIADDRRNHWTILLFARLDPEKGVDIAMEGIVRFVRRHTGVRVRLLDWGPLKVQYRLRYGHCFEFIPLVAPDEVEHLILSADVIIGQFALGALGLSEFQAMSCARPVIASFCYNDAYPTSPPICQAASASEIDERLEYLFQNPEMAKSLGRQAREWIIENHDYRILAIRLEKLYQSILLEK